MKSKQVKEYAQEAIITRFLQAVWEKVLMVS